MESSSEEWGHAQNVWARDCQQFPFLPAEHLGLPLHWNYWNSILKEVQETSSTLF